MTHFAPRDERGHSKANGGYSDVPDYCINCGRPFMDHYNGQCPSEIDTDISLKIENVVGGLRNYGYLVAVKPLPGREQEYYKALRDGLLKIDVAIESYRRHFGVRGTNTKRIREMLWRDLPEPCWGVTAPINRVEG